MSRRGSISIPIAPVAPVRENKDEKKQEGLKTINLKIDEISKHVESLEYRKVCSCDQVEARLLKELKLLQLKLTELIEN